ncbi:DUF58 domain-containing protein [Natronorarus salvus]|uniref:DUF58 domain-containing protein n=1 Tax=Natronorarus salvus TaxID=3117733 RepID=UPI002F26425A
MRFTRRYWATASLVAVLSGGAVVLVQPVLFFGAALVGGWLLARQFAFVDELNSTVESLELSQTLEKERAVSGTPVPLVVTASLQTPATLDIHVRGGVPVTASASSQAEFTIEPGVTEESRVIDLQWGVAGKFTLQEAAVTAADPYGLFTEQVSMGTTPTITVEPRGPRSVHLGRAGEQVRRALGDHEVDPLDVGLEPEEVRQYVPGDAVRMIDWKATARFDFPHVRTFETETDRTTILIMDHRGPMGMGHEGETKLDYARHAGLLFAREARARRDPLGFYAVSGDGTSLRHPPTGTNRGYAAIRAHLYDLNVNEAGDVSHRGGPLMRKNRRTAGRLIGDDSPFAITLRTYLTHGDSSVVNTERKPLLACTRMHVDRQQGATRTVIVTDDSHGEEVREAAMIARRGNNRVVVVLTPTVLFEPEGLGDLATAYDRYVEFERFRRSLDVIDRVEALELGPGERLSAVLNAGERRSPERRSPARS